MPHKLAEHPKAVEWLQQFDGRRIHVARLLLDLLKLVPTAECERRIKQQIISICNETEGRLALFPVDRGLALEERQNQFYIRKFGGRSAKFEEAIVPNSEVGPKVIISEEELEKRPRRQRFSSAGRIGHILEALKGEFPRRISVGSTTDSMRAERVKHIVLVDDLISTGSSISNFWKFWATPSLRSWLSRGNCKLWIVAYAAHQEGIATVERKVPYVHRERLRFEVMLPSTDDLWPAPVLDLCEEYGRLTGKPGAARGFQGILSPIVFQYRCPNSTSSILWDSSRTKWKALFPNRNIPIELTDCFEIDGDQIRHAEVLWKSAQYRLALKLLDDLQNGRKNKDHQLALTLLGLLGRNIRLERLAPMMLLSDERITGLLEVISQLGLATPDGKITGFGKDLLKRSRGTFLVGNKYIQPNEEAISFYFPKQFRGVQGKSSEKGNP
jgi:hypothetical protein